MRERLIPLSIFLVISILLFVFSQPASSLLDFVSKLTFGPREFLYSAAHAETKPSELDQLKIENNKLRQQLSDLESIKKDNVALRSQFEDTTISPTKLLPAKVVGNKGSVDNPTAIIIDQGARSGIAKGMAVILKNNLVGKVTKLSPYQSEVILITNQNFSTLATASKSNSPGIIHGENDFLLLDHVVITDNLGKEDTVITKGDGSIPSNLLIGKIISVNKSESSPFQSALVKTLIELKKLRTVFVVK